jgi:thiamine-monophosphate kinase
LSEAALIRQIADATRVRGGTTIGIGDDAAVLDGAEPLVLTVDLLVEDVHFRAPFSSHDLGHKSLAVNLSDLAAMGAEPVAAVVGLALPPGGGLDIEQFYRGMDALAERHGVTVAGGDLSSGATLTISVSALGRLRRGCPPLTRRGARPGDMIVVTGPVGRSEAGRAALESASVRAAVGDAAAGRLITAHRRPEPQLAIVPALRELGVTALMDCSDGLMIDVGRMAEASGCAAVVDLDAVPIDPDVSAVAEALGEDAAIFAATGGEDYPLIAALDPAARPALEAALPRAEVVGVFASGSGTRAERDGAVVELARPGYTHDV